MKTPRNVCLRQVVDVRYAKRGAGLRRFDGTFRACVITMTDPASHRQHVYPGRCSCYCRRRLFLLRSVVCCTRPQRWWIADTPATNIYCVRRCPQRYPLNFSGGYRPLQPIDFRCPQLMFRTFTHCKNKIRLKFLS